MRIFRCTPCVDAAGQSLIEVDGIRVEVLRKPVKNLNLRVKSPDGRVRVSVPLHAGDDRVRMLVASKLDWIRRQQARLRARPQVPGPLLVTGESIVFLGRHYRLRVVEGHARSRAVADGNELVMHVRPGNGRESRQALLDAWYRAGLKARIPALIERWEPVMDVCVADWGVRRMKTRWGSCNISARRVWLNLALARYPEECLEYVLVHEMAHLLERHHCRRFYALMDRFLPDWRERDARLRGCQDQGVS